MTKDSANGRSTKYVYKLITSCRMKCRWQTIYMLHLLLLILGDALVLLHTHPSTYSHLSNIKSSWLRVRALAVVHICNRFQQEFNHFLVFCRRGVFHCIIQGCSLEGGGGWRLYDLTTFNNLSDSFTKITPSRLNLIQAIPKSWSIRARPSTHPLYPLWWQTTTYTLKSLLVFHK